MTNRGRMGCGARWRREPRNRQRRAMRGVICPARGQGRVPRHHVSVFRAGAEDAGCAVMPGEAPDDVSVGQPTANGGFQSTHNRGARHDQRQQRRIDSGECREALGIRPLSRYRVDPSRTQLGRVALRSDAVVCYHGYAAIFRRASRSAAKAAPRGNKWERAVLTAFCRIIRVPSARPAVRRAALLERCRITVLAAAKYERPSSSVGRAED